jgi:hypothetical protein
MLSGAKCGEGASANNVSAAHENACLFLAGVSFRDQDRYRYFISNNPMPIASAEALSANSDPIMRPLEFG